VKLGLEVTAGRFAAGQPVTIRPFGGGPPIPSRLTIVGRTADPTSKTIDAFAPLGPDTVPIGSNVEAEVTTGTHPGTIVPRASVVFDETGTHVFAIANGKARRMFVTTGRDFKEGTEEWTEVLHGLAAGTVVAVQGAYELQDGMAVKVTRP